MKALIFVNRHKVNANKKASKVTGNIADQPAIGIKTYRGSTHCKEIEFTQVAKLIQDSQNPICSGATIRLEADYKTLIIDGNSNVKK